MSGDGDGWVQCSAGHRHWGRFGAAGLLIADSSRAILQHRAPWTHEGGTWGLPGGARDSHEDATTTALREAGEEAAIPSAAIDPIAMWVDDHGGWSYTTVLARPLDTLHPHAANAESTEIRWWSEAEIDSLPLHHGLAATWPRVRRAPTPVLIVIDSQSDARLDEPAANGRLDQLIRGGVRLGALPSRADPGPVSVLLPRVAVIAGGVIAEPQTAGSAGNPLSVADTGDAWWRRSHQILQPDVDMRDTVIQLCTQHGALRQVLVVSADEDLADQLQSLADVVGPDWLFAQIDLLD